MKTKPAVRALAKRANGVPVAVAQVDKSRFLEIGRGRTESEDRAVARVLSDSLVTNASTAIRFLHAEHPGLSLNDMVHELREQGQAINRGDLAMSERMLNAQSMTLNSIFIEMARRSALNMGEHLEASDRYMRLALKAQAQCRATVETLSEMKNPHAVAFVKQANIANGAQQINNGLTSTHPSARAKESRSLPIKQLEQQHVERMDTGAKGSASGANSDMATVGTVHRAEN